MEFQDIDLNLLVVFNELLRQRSVSAAAETLGITQPAISNALNRLRKVMGDELFLRTSKGMMPMPFAETWQSPSAMRWKRLITLSMSLLNSTRLRPHTPSPSR